MAQDGVDIYADIEDFGENADVCKLQLIFIKHILKYVDAQ
jgi:hypothetical protein